MVVLPNVFLCNNKTGDEKHALLECSYLNDLRNDFFAQLIVNFPHLHSLSLEQKLHYLLLCIEVNPTVKFAIYVGKFLKLYKKCAKEIEMNKCTFKEKTSMPVTTRAGRIIVQPCDRDYVFYK